MPITHILVIVDDAEGIDDMVHALGMLDIPHEAHLLVTDTVQGAVNMLAVGHEDLSFTGKLNG